MDQQQEIEKMAFSICPMPQAAEYITDCAKCGYNGDCPRQKYAKKFMEKGYGDVRAAEHRAEVAELVVKNLNDILRLIIKQYLSKPKKNSRRRGKMKAEEKIECLEKKLKQALSWWRTAEKKLSQKCAETKANQRSIEQLKSENAALRERLKKAVELKAKVGDTIFLPWIYDDVSGVCELQVCAIHFLYDGSIIYSTDLEKGYEEGFEERRFLMKYHYGEFSQDDFGSMVFTTIEAAESAPIT